MSSVQEVPSDPAKAACAAIGIHDGLHDYTKGFPLYLSVLDLVPESDQITFLEWAELTLCFGEWFAHREFISRKVRKGTVTSEVMKAKPMINATCSMDREA